MIVLIVYYYDSIFHSDDADATAAAFGGAEPPGLGFSNAVRMHIKPVFP